VESAYSGRQKRRDQSTFAEFMKRIVGFVLILSKFWKKVTTPFWGFTKKLEVEARLSPSSWLCNVFSNG
jgi:hypothetical protein